MSLAIFSEQITYAAENANKHNGKFILKLPYSQWLKCMGHNGTPFPHLQFMAMSGKDPYYHRSYLRCT